MRSMSCWNEVLERIWKVDTLGTPDALKTLSIYTDEESSVR